jgi:hypothetical protein
MDLVKHWCDTLFIDGNSTTHISPWNYLLTDHHNQNGDLIVISLTLDTGVSGMFSIHIDLRENLLDHDFYNVRWIYGNEEPKQENRLRFYLK